MLLKNLMEEKQLDFNRPLLSVRRFSSTETSSEVGGKRKTDNSPCCIPPPPFYKSELKSGPIRKPGTVPFLWEQIPGRPKDESKSRTRALERPAITPKLPPGRNLNVKQQPLDKGTENQTITRPQMENISYSSKNVPSLGKNEAKFESSKEGIEEKQSSSSEDGDEAYVDALDTLSRTESFFLNCSISGISGLDGPDMKPSGTFSTDPQTRDFMMGRFLPAAKAIASETPQYVSRKQHVPREQPRQVNKVVSWDKRPPRYHYRPNFVPHYAQDNGEEESEDEDGDYDQPENLAGKICGLFPRLGLKNSLCLLNPVPGMRTQAQAPVSSVRRAQAKPSYAGSLSATEVEHVRDTVYEQRSTGGLQKAELHEDESNMKSKTNHVSYQNNSQRPDGSFPCSRLQGGGISPYRNEFPQSFNEEKGFLGIPEEAKGFRVNGLSSHKKGCISFQELLASDNSKWESDPASPAVEKTVYIDSIQMVASRNSNSSFSDMKGILISGGNDFEILVKTKGMEETSFLDCSREDIKTLNITNEKAMLQPKILESVDLSLLSSSDISNQEVQMDTMKGFRKDQDLIKDPITLAGTEGAGDGKVDHENQQPPKTDQENSHGAYPQFPLPPPLPKSPSESWLCRTLPSISSRNPSSRSYLGMHMYDRPHASKTTTLDPKWETIVKTSKSHHGHLRFSEAQNLPKEKRGRLWW
ncbi:hypothetical protein L1049_024062 [Liquidambar formosana]|uniref:Uncharacterized protein n=1 Tax=Liquidambar formosana TaxID=63359 RepID=A0AAP0RZU8_LIQFO